MNYYTLDHLILITEVQSKGMRDAFFQNQVTQHVIVIT